MKADPARLERALARPADSRFFLFHGPDEAGSRALARRIGEALGDEAERIDLTGADLKADPARLADEAAAISMFGGARWILVEPAGDEAAAAVEALVEAPMAGNPVALVAGALKPSSRLLKAALAAPSALAFASYAPEGAKADRLVAEMARAEGLEARPDVARRIAASCAGNRAAIGQELAKFALYLDSSPQAPRTLDHDAIDALGAGADEGTLGRLVEAAVGGDQRGLEEELARLRTEGIEGIPLARAVLRRLLLLARLRGEAERGGSVAAAMASPAAKAVFWREKDAVAAQLARWRAPLVTKAVSRLVEAERQVKAPGGPGPVAVDEELFALCRQAARLR